MKLCEVLHYYLGFEVQTKDGIGKLSTYNIESGGCEVVFGVMSPDYSKIYFDDGVKLLLRPLSDMTEEEADYFAWLCIDSRHHLDKDSRISQEEIQIELATYDGGNMLDGDIDVYIGVSVRCFEGAILIKKDGSIFVTDDNNDKQEPIDDIACKVHYLIKQGFDVFNLIESGQAIDKTTL